MPNRIIKDSICTSETLDRLTDAEEAFFYRLIVNCDDYGLMDARPVILRTKLYPLRLDTFTEAVLMARLAALERIGLIQRYAVEGRPYLMVCGWDKHQQIRAHKSKYPKPLISPDINGYQRKSDDSPNVIQSNPIQSNPQCDSSHDESEVLELQLEDVKEPEGVASAYPQWFEDGWKQYPNPTGKRAGYNAACALLKLPLKDRPTFEQLRDAMTHYGEAMKAKADYDPTKCKHCATFFSKRDRWYEEWIERRVEPPKPSAHYTPSNRVTDVPRIVMPKEIAAAMEAGR